MPLITCERCHEDLPLSEFRELNHGAICNACMSSQNAKVAQAAIAEQAKSVAAELAAMNPDEIGHETAKVRTVLSEVYRHFGGVSGFSQHLYYVAMELSKRRPMPAAAGQLLLQLLKIHHNVEQSESEISAREMTDEQLRRQQNIEVTKMMIDSLADPKRRRALESVLKREGFRLEDGTPAELIESVPAMVEEMETVEPSDESIINARGSDSIEAVFSPKEVEQISTAELKQMLEGKK